MLRDALSDHRCKIQRVILVLVLVVVLGRFFVEDEHDDEDDFQASAKPP